MTTTFIDEMQKLVADRMKYILTHKEELIAAWAAQTGFAPDQAMLVQQDMGDRINFWVESKTDRCLTHRNELAVLTRRIVKLQAVAEAFGSVASEEKVRETLLCYVQGARALEALDALEADA